MKSDKEMMAKLKKTDFLISEILKPFEKKHGFVFNRIDDPDGKSKGDVKPLGKPRKGNLKHKLNKALKDKNKLKRMLPEEASEYQRSAKWKAAMSKAQGDKIKDDPKMLKKAIKRKEKTKQKHKRDWTERLQKKEEAKKMVDKKKQKNKEKRLQLRKEALKKKRRR